jgi:uncharacterized coiled-coil protein SlyX
MTEHTNTYPDLASVEDWLNAKGYTGEAGACHAAMSLIRKQEARIAELESMIAVHRLAVDVDALKARIAELEAALSDTTAHLVAAVSLLERGGKKAAPSNTMFEQMLVDHKNSIERARAALEKKND